MPVDEIVENWQMKIGMNIRKEEIRSYCQEINHCQ
jgi:hypothetical protein